MKPFEGIRILDFTQALSGPFATMYLSDFGAEVIKIERRGMGDQSREWGPNRNDYSSYFANFNRGKKSFSLDMSKEEGKEIVRRLVKECDVLIENFKVGVMDKLGLGYDELKKINPDLIYGCITGFGLQGPLSKLPCYDVVAAARSGIMDVSGEDYYPPVKPGFSLGDNWTGMNFLYGTLMALYYKKKTGISIKFDVAMLDSLFYMLDTPILKYSAFGELQEKTGNHSTEYAPYGVYAAKDGFIAAAITKEEQWTKFCQLLGCEHWAADEKYATNEKRLQNKKELIQEIEKVTSTMNKAEIQKIMIAQDLPVMEVLNIPETVESPQLLSRDMLLEINQPCIGKLKVSGNPMKFSNPETAGQIMGYGPMLGENTEDVLRDILCCTDEEINTLYKNEVI